MNPAALYRLCRRLTPDIALSDKKPLSYRDAGVDIDAGNRLVEAIKPLVRATHRPGVLGGLGGFAGLFELPTGRFRQPVLVSGTDGVGTKLRLAISSGRHDQIGIDLVAMCANDVIVAGAEPLFFLDYYATGQLSVDVATDVISGIAEGCQMAGMALIGGETAEMPGMYQGGDYDLAGFCVGICEKDRLLDGSRVRPGDILIGLGSSGPHSNGYSLIRKVLEVSGAAPDMAFADSTLIDHLLRPTRIYVKPLLALLEALPVGAMAHITGGGLPENLPRVLPAGLGAEIRLETWRRPAVFDWLQAAGNIDQQELLRTFNCGIGMVVCIPEAHAADARRLLETHGETAFEIGRISADFEGLRIRP